jgi:putative membrane protein
MSEQTEQSQQKVQTEQTFLKTTDELASDRTDLAYERTALANDRTLMAWVRTSTSLISFGFTIYKFFQDIANVNQPKIGAHLISSRHVGMILILFGFLGLLFGLLQYHTDLKRIRASYTKVRLKSFTPYLAMLMLIFSLLLFGLALFGQ